MRRRTILSLAVVFVWLAASGGGSAQSPSTPTFTMALTGDTEIARKMSVHSEPEFLALLDVMRSADVGFTNLELLFHDYEYPAAAEADGPYQRADPALAKELAWMGIDMVSRANNHAGDFGTGAMQLTSRYVKEAGLIEAGTGNSLAEAREARFLETAKGRVALVSVASTFPDHSRAGKSRDDIPARPGLSPLRFSTTYTLTSERIAQLRTAAEELGLNTGPGWREGGKAEADEIRFMGRRFVTGPAPDVSTTPNQEDVTEIAQVVSNASRLADYTIVTIHAHEGHKSRFVPAQFLVTFARAMIDAGADVFVGHGPHLLRGIELYKGKPIMYSLGNFIYQNETLLRLPQENYDWYKLGPDAGVADFIDRHYDKGRRGFPGTALNAESVIAVPHFRGKALVEIRLYPVSLGFGKPITVRGRPMLADETLGRKIIADLTRLSEPFGTTVLFENGVGVIRPSTPSTSAAR